MLQGLFFAVDKPVYLQGAGSFAELDVFHDNTKFAVSMDVKPLAKDGMIVYGDDRRSLEFVSIGINNGFVEVRYISSDCFYFNRHLIQIIVHAAPLLL